VGYWKLNETVGATSLADSGSMGTNSGTPSSITLGTNGKVNTAASFDGSISYIDIPRVSTNLDATSSLTISAWVFHTDTGSGNSSQGIILEKGNYGGNNGAYLLRMDTNNHYMLALYQGSWKILTSSSTVSAGSWHHLVGTWDGSTMRLYQDGVLDTASLANSTVRIGRIKPELFNPSI
jgi:hypothetical protein